MEKTLLFTFILQIILLTPIFPQMWDFVDTGLGDSSFIYSSTQINGKIFFGLARSNGYTFYIPGGFLMSNNNGNDWEYNGVINSYYPEPVPISSFIKKDSMLFVGTGGIGIFKSTDWGDTWITCNNGLTGNAYLVKTFKVVNDKIYAGTQNGIFVSENNGENWKEINNGLPFNLSGYYSVIDILFMNDTLYAGIFSSWDRNGGIYRTEINNIEWKPFLTKINNQRLDVYSLKLFDSRLFLATNIGVYISPDNGVNWDYSGIPYVIETFKKDKNNILATGASIYLSQDNGATWQDIRFNLSNYINSGFGYFYTGEIVDNTIFVGTVHIGIWKIGIESITSVNSNKTLVKDYILYQNFPNPFNPSTTINYQIAKASNVTIKIFDCLGREIKILVNEFKRQGFYTINFDASFLSSGIYFYQLRAGEFTSTKKMIVLR